MKRVSAFLTILLTMITSSVILASDEVGIDTHSVPKKESNSELNADDGVIRLQGISIKGDNQEPYVLYITPWSPPPGTGRLYEPISSYRTHWFRPLTRSRLKREMYYGERYVFEPDHMERLRDLLGTDEK